MDDDEIDREQLKQEILEELKIRAKARFLHRLRNGETRQEEAVQWSKIGG